MESCAAYSTHCNICQEIFFGPHHSSPLWVNASVPILMNHKWWPYGALDQHSPATATAEQEGWKRLRMLYQMDFTHLHIQKTMYPGSGKYRVSLYCSLYMCADSGRHPSTFFLFVTLPVCLKVPLPSSSTPFHMVRHKEELLITIEKDF